MPPTKRCSGSNPAPRRPLLNRARPADPTDPGDAADPGAPWGIPFIPAGNLEFRNRSTVIKLVCGARNAIVNHCLPCGNTIFTFMDVVKRAPFCGRAAAKRVAERPQEGPSSWAWRERRFAERRRCRRATTSSSIAPRANRRSTSMSTGSRGRSTCCSSLRAARRSTWREFRSSSSPINTSPSSRRRAS